MTFAAKVRAVHRSSALLLFGFALLHLVNHVVGVGGVAAHQTFMDAARWIYRTPIAEPVLVVVAIAAQVATGAHLIWQRWGLRTDVWPKLQAISGAYLALLPRQSYRFGADFPLGPRSRKRLLSGCLGAHRNALASLLCAILRIGGISAVRAYRLCRAAHPAE